MSSVGGSTVTTYMMMMVDMTTRRVHTLHPMEWTQIGTPKWEPHITSNELNKMTTHDKYKGRNRVYTAEGNGMIISHIGYSKLRTPHSILHLNEILHTPHASKKFMSIHKLTLDNNVLIEFHPWFFFKGSGHANDSV
jgi:hypothetical protein